MRTIFDNILLELAECDITDKYNAGLLSHCEYYALYGVAFNIREEIFSK